MTAISTIYNSAYVSGSVAISLNRGELAIICGQWTWNTNRGYEFASIDALVNGVPLTGYRQDIDGDGTDSSGNYMGIFPYLATDTGSVNIALSPGDSVLQEQYIQLTVIKLTPSPGKFFAPGNYVAASGVLARSLNGTKTIPLANTVGDILVGIATSLNPNATLQIAWQSPATEQVDEYVNGYLECTVATQISSSLNASFSYVEAAAYFNGAVAVAIRERSAAGVIFWI